MILLQHQKPTSLSLLKRNPQVQHLSRMNVKPKNQHREWCSRSASRKLYGNNVDNEYCNSNIDNQIIALIQYILITRDIIKKCCVVVLYILTSWCGYACHSRFYRSFLPPIFFFTFSVPENFNSRTRQQQQQQPCISPVLLVSL